MEKWMQATRRVSRIKLACGSLYGRLVWINGKGKRKNRNSVGIRKIDWIVFLIFFWYFRNWRNQYSSSLECEHGWRSRKSDSTEVYWSNAFVRKLFFFRKMGYKGLAKNVGFWEKLNVIEVCYPYFRRLLRPYLEVKLLLNGVHYLVLSQKEDFLWIHLNTHNYMFCVIKLQWWKVVSSSPFDSDFFSWEIEKTSVIEVWEKLLKNFLKLSHSIFW